MKYAVVGGVLAKNTEDKLVLFCPQTDFFVELNLTAAFIWNLLKQSPSSKQRIVAFFQQEFEVGFEEATVAVGECLIDLINANVVLKYD